MKILNITIIAIAIFGLLPFTAFAAMPAGVVGNYKQAVVKYKLAKDLYTSAKADYAAAKAEWALKKDFALVRAGLKKYLNKTCGVMIGVFEKVQAQVSAEDAATVETWITYLENKQAELAAATNKSEIIAIAKDLHQKWVNNRKEVKLMVGKAADTKITGILNNANGLYDKLNVKISELKAKGIDTAQAETLLAEYKTKIGLASQKYGEAKTKYGEAVNATAGSDERANLIADGHKLLIEAHAALKQARITLWQMAKAVKQKVGEPTTNYNTVPETNTTETPDNEPAADEPATDVAGNNENAGNGSEGA